jgi:assimilatory nitrate reductase catalytic subunit
VRDKLIDLDYICRRTEGFGAVRASVAGYWPERVERLTGVPEAQLLQAARLLGTAHSAIVLTGRGAEQQAQGVNNALAFINIALALGLAGRPASGYGCLTGQGNGQGGREHGQKADQLPGYRRIDDPVARRELARTWGVAEASLPHAGRSAYELIDSIGEAGGVRALLVVGSNPAVSAPNALVMQRRLQRLDFLAVADFFLSETAQLADVVLPAAQWAEEDGTMTNLEGRVILRRRAFPPPDGVRTDVEILCDLAEQLGAGTTFAFGSASAVFDELRHASAGGAADYAGITYEKIAARDGVFWPCPDAEHPGTPRLFADGFPTPSGKARFHAVRHLPPDEEPDAEYPLYLTTGRLLAHYQSGTQTHRVPQLEQLAREPLAEVHPSVAKRLGLADGEPATLATRRGAARFRLKVTPNIREDTVFVPFHWGGVRSANRLTNPALDPISRMPEFKVCAVRIERCAAEE